jgi:hypothetical protein
VGKKTPKGKALLKAAQRWTKNEKAYESSTDSRQQARARSRRKAKEHVTNSFGPEPRENRRALELAFAKTFDKQERIRVIKP